MNVLFVLSFICIHKVSALNILAVFPYPGSSHFFVFRPYLEELAKRGHNVTVISHFPKEKPVVNYTDISLTEKQNIEETFPMERNYMGFLYIGNFLIKIASDTCKLLLGNENVQQLWRDDVKFDVVVTEAFCNDCTLGLAHKLGTPVVGVTSHVLMPWHYERFGIRDINIVFPLTDGGSKPNLFQRLERIVCYFFFNVIFKHIVYVDEQKTLAEYFDNIPPLEELARDIKFVLLYQHFVLSGSNALPSNLIQVGGYHISQPKKLPHDIKKFIDESEHGVIYISFGSMLKASTTPKDKLEAIIGALSELPQRVIWKWDEKTLPQNPKNIFLSNWLPQNDILAHPKVLAFFSHCGLLGTTEAIYHGVPVVGMPVFGDQPANGAAVEESGLGVQIQVKDLTKEALLEKFKIVLNPEFKNKVKKLSEAWRDRPISAMDSAIYWTEFAARHPNFTFRTRAADVPFYQYLYLDVFCVISGIVFIFVYIIKILLSLVVSTKSKEFKNKIKKKN